MKKIKLKLNIANPPIQSQNQNEQTAQYNQAEQRLSMPSKLHFEENIQKRNQTENTENIEFQQTSPLIKFPTPNKVNSQVFAHPSKLPPTHNASKQIEINHGDFMEDTTSLKNAIAEANKVISKNISKDENDSIDVLDAYYSQDASPKKLDNEEMMQTQKSKIELLEKRNDALESNIKRFEEKYNGLQSILSADKQPNQQAIEDKSMSQEDDKEADNSMQSLTSDANAQNNISDQMNMEDLSDYRILKKALSERNKQIANYKDFIRRIREHIMRIIDADNEKSKTVEEMTKNQINFITKNYHI